MLVGLRGGGGFIGLEMKGCHVGKERDEDRRKRDGGKGDRCNIQRSISASSWPVWAEVDCYQELCSRLAVWTRKGF